MRVTSRCFYGCVHSMTKPVSQLALVETGNADQLKTLQLNSNQKQMGWENNTVE